MTTQQEALQRIANMDPKGQRADDLGRAARIAREALQTPTANVDAIKAVEAIHTICWWHTDGYPVFNNANGDDLILRKDVIRALTEKGST